MVDTYRNFEALAGREKRFRCRRREAAATTLVLAPHGGEIEAGTSEVADAVAGTDYPFYAFEGLRTTHNKRLHITSTRFDEPQCCEMLAKASTAVAIHGEGSLTRIVFLGGRDARAKQRVRQALEAAGLVVRTHRSANLQGVEPMNICNRVRSGRGVQLELSKGLRRSFFAGLSRVGRRTKTNEFYKFVTALRSAISDE